MEQTPLKTEPVDVSKTDRFAGIKKFLKKRPPKKRLIIVAGVSAAVLLIGGVAAFTLISNPKTLNPEPEIVSNYVAPEKRKPSPLTGVLVNPELTKRPITGVMIENSIDARPQSGLSQAGIVFEAIAEGGITRFLALFQESRPGNIGPIRSARPYYVEWAKGFDAQYLHSGGSGEALALIQSLGVKDLDHGKLSGRIASRVSSRFAPHNVYTNFDTIDKVSQELGYGGSEFKPLSRSEAAPENLPEKTAGNIKFDISGANYNTSYDFAPETNDYGRVMAGRPHTDQEGGQQIRPKVVVALIAPYGIHPNGIHSQYGSTGSGEVLVFQNGTVTKGQWKKESQSASLQFVKTDGSALKLNPGQTWITAIPQGRVSYTP
jgi:hypothetical protein